jgi:hypothetical protein
MKIHARKKKIHAREDIDYHFLSPCGVLGIVIALKPVLLISLRVKELEMEEVK